MTKSPDDLELFMTNLLGETLPNNSKTALALDTYGLKKEDIYIALQLVLSNKLTRLISGFEGFNLNEWKQQFRENILACFDNEQIQPLTFLTLQPFTRTVILRLQPTTTSAHHMATLGECFEQLNVTIEKNYETSIIGCYGQLVNDFYAISSSYKSARKIQESTYIIGKGAYAFFDNYSSDNTYSLLEYKHLHQFEQLFTSKDYTLMFDLLSEIKTNLIEQSVNNSKTAYIYKELFATTIRQLYDRLSTYKKTIETLNESITMFDHMFDDIHDIHNFYVHILRGITGIESDSRYHPYIKKTLFIVNTEYMIGLSLNYFSDIFSISPAYFSRLFKEEVGINFKAYLTKYRIDIAKDLLISSSKDINTISASVGYQSASQFLRAFKQSEGMTPSKYRLYNESK